MLVALLAFSSTLFGKGFEPPAKGKAVVYFVRVTSYGYAMTFEYFDGDKYIGAFKKKNYMRYECDPGEHLFWASSENKEFLPADLKPDATYIVIVDVVIGGWKAHVGLRPITPENTKDFERALELVNSKDPIDMPEKEIEKMNKKLAKFIPKMLDRYENEWKAKRNFHHISPDMAIPEEYLK